MGGGAGDGLRGVPVLGDPLVLGDPPPLSHLRPSQILEDEIPELGWGVEEEELEPGRGDTRRFSPLAAGPPSVHPQTMGGSPQKPERVPPNRGTHLKTSHAPLP